MVLFLQKQIIIATSYNYLNVKRLFQWEENISHSTYLPSFLPSVSFDDNYLHRKQTCILESENE